MEGRVVVEEKEKTFDREKTQITLKLVFIGDAGVGKSALLHKYAQGVFPTDYKCTVGVAFDSKTIEIDDYVVTLQIWDTAGQERFRSLCVAYFRGADAGILVYDASRVASLRDLAMWKEDFLMHSGSDPTNPAPLFVLRNKIDLPIQEISEPTAIEWCNQQKCTHFSVSARTGKGIDEAFFEIAKAALKFRLSKEPSEKKSVFLPEVPKAPKSGCGGRCLIDDDGRYLPRNNFYNYTYYKNNNDNVRLNEDEAGIRNLENFSSRYIYYTQAQHLDIISGYVNPNINRNRSRNVQLHHLE
jgi:Ras-related protein Rab-7A